jgi:hypothetical protein
MKTYPLPIPPYPEMPQKTGRQVVDELILYHKRKIAQLKTEFKPEPHPLDFSLATPEEERDERYAIHLHNTRINDAIAGHEWDIEALTNTYIKIPESKIFKDYASGI